jgi:hypothetical protein
MVLKNVFWPNREDVTGDWTKLHNEELHDLYSSSNIILVIKSRTVIWAGHVARTQKIRNSYKVLAGQAEGKGSL